MRYHLPLLALAILISAATATAQVFQVVPPNPTTSDQVILHSNSGFSSATVTQTGNHFRVDVIDCGVLCPGPFNVSLGTLPAGMYTYDIFVDGILEESGTFVVTQALPIVPTLSEYALLTLAVLLAGAGWLFVGRRT